MSAPKPATASLARPTNPGPPVRDAAAPKPHTRVNETPLSGLERSALRFLAARMPAWVTPDRLTALGFGACVLILAGYALSHLGAGWLWLANAGFALNWFGDSLDGTLARHRKIERPKYGYFIDHTVDSINMLLVGLGLGLSPYVRMDLALLAIAGYFMMSILTYITTYVRGVFQLSYGRLGPTEVRLLVVAVNTLVWAFGNPTLSVGVGRLSAFDLVALGAGCALIATYAVSMLREARELSAVDRPRAA